MTVKIMKGSGKGSFYKKVFISSYSRETVYFQVAGRYFTKTKATLSGRDPVYKKSQGFRVTNDESGYSVLTLTFTIIESAEPESSGQTISKKEFDEN